MAIYVRETIKVVPGKKDEYLKAVEKQYLPVANKYGVKLFGYWEAVDVQNMVALQGLQPPDLVAMWEFDDWSQLSKLIKARYSPGKDDVAIRE